MVQVVYIQQSSQGRAAFSRVSYVFVAERFKAGPVGCMAAQKLLVARAG